MNQRSLRSPGPRPVIWLILAVGLFVSLIALGAATPSPARADAGGFPTPTPTNTPIPPTLTPTFTPTFILLPTATFTSVPGVGVTETPPLVIVTEVPTTAAPPTDGGAGGLACLPIALIVILGVVIGATWLFTRTTTP